jgi:hypothetical protein
VAYLRTKGCEGEEPPLNATQGTAPRRSKNPGEVLGAEMLLLKSGGHTAIEGRRRLT